MFIRRSIHFHPAAVIASPSCSHESEGWNVLRCQRSGRTSARERRVSRGLAVGDLFNDGNMDVVVSDLDGVPMVLKNHGIPGRHWVSFELAGTKSNRLALNARIKIIKSAE